MVVSKFNTVLIAAGPQLGDALTTFPTAGWLKRSRPDCRVLLCSSTYAEPLARACEHIDGFFSTERIASDPGALASEGIDALLNLHSDQKLARIAKEAGIPFRVTNLRRPAGARHSNRFEIYSRSNGHLHSVGLNLRMLRALGIHATPPEAMWPALFGLTRLPVAGRDLALLDPNRFNLVLHPKSAGHGREWPLRHYLKLLDWLPPERFKVFVTGTADEAQRIRRELPEFLGHPHVTDLMGRFSLEEFIGFLSRIDGLVASGTGPVHIAAALGRHALGIFPPRRAMNEEKWRPIGANAQSISFHDGCSRRVYACQKATDGSACACMTAIPAYRVYIRLAAWSECVQGRMGSGRSLDQQWL